MMLRHEGALETMIGTSAAMARLRRTIDKVAARVHPVLIRGESGTGKELVGRAIHAQSDRRERRCGQESHLITRRWLPTTARSWHAICYN